MNPLLNDLNEPQKQAVINYEGPSLVVAGAGSGKTRVITYRIAYMLSKGVNPSSILALTFTNKAADEMKERIASLVGQDLARKLWMGTFHSIFARILRYEGNILGYPSNYTIYDTIDSKNLIRTIIKELNLDDNIYKPSEVYSRISFAKNNLVTADAYGSIPDIISRDSSTRRPMISEIYRRYSARCKISGAMDFDDLLLNTNILFHEHPEILKKYQDIFHYVLVDEYQDTNYCQYLIIKKLAQEHRNICVVGDDAQSIYSFRGARIENILNFRKDYNNIRLYKLEQNYRSTQTIVNAANSIIIQNKDQISKNLFSEKQEGEKITVMEARSDNEEGFLIANLIKDRLFAERIQYKDFAILYRTNAQSRIFEESLRKMNIPYRIFGSLSFFQRKEIKDVLAYFNLTINPGDDEALKRIINYPLRGIGKTSLQKIEETAHKQRIPMWEVINNPMLVEPPLNSGTIKKIRTFIDLIQGFRKKLSEMEAFDLAFTIVNETAILKDLYQDKTPEGVSRYENVQELLNGIKEFTDAADKTQNNTLTDYIQTVTLYTDADYDREEDDNKVNIMTAHSAKGLEFRYVFIVGLEEELFPLQMSALIPKELEEERRLFYVALTRAKESVMLSYASTRYRWGLLTQCNPSRFIREIDDKYLDFPYKSRKLSVLNNEPYIRQNSTHQRSENNTSILGTARKFLRMDTHVDPKFDQNEDPADIVVGAEVEHARFGTGKVISKEGYGQNFKITVFFKAHGQKQLLLKFAKLRLLKKGK